MFSNTFQSGFISVFYSVGSNPLQLWDKSVKNGHIRRVIDDEVKSLVLELSGTNVATTYITCPIKPRASLGIKLPFLVMVIKNMKKYFTFEIQILDDKDMHRRFRVSNFQSTTKVRPFCTTMPIGLSSGWNQIQFNLADFTRRAYGSSYLETMRVQIHANVRIRRIYFADRLYGDEEMPQEYKLFLPVPGTQKRLSDARRPSKDVGVPAKRGSKQSDTGVAPAKTESVIAAPETVVDPLPLVETEISSAAPPGTPVESPTSPEALEEAVEVVIVAEPAPEEVAPDDIGVQAEADAEATAEPLEAPIAEGETVETSGEPPSEEVFSSAQEIPETPTEEPSTDTETTEAATDSPTEE